MNRKREWERRKSECFIAAMTLADTVAMGYLPSPDVIDAYRTAERALTTYPRKKPR